MQKENVKRKVEMCRATYVCSCDRSKWSALGRSVKRGKESHSAEVTNDLHPIGGGG